MITRYSRRSVLTRFSAAGSTLLMERTLPALFMSPTEPASPHSKEAATLIAYFREKAPELLREARGQLRFPSISPSLPHSTYSSELWDWDTLWTTRGLFRVAQLTGDRGLHSQIADHVRGSLDNFFDHQSSEGRIPMLISVQDSDPLGCLKGQRPHKENQAKPVLAQLALLLADESGEVSWFALYLDKLQAFYRSWTIDNMSSSGLFVWGDDVAIGNDNDPTTFGRPYFSSANLLLNCLFYQDLMAAAELARRLKFIQVSTQFGDAAKSLGSAVQRHCWDPRDQFFYTADVQCIDRRAELIPNIRRGMPMSWESIPIRIQTFTGFLPMWCGLATREQSTALVEHLSNPKTFFSNYGVRTLSAQESMYSLAQSTNPSNWLGPIWIISNYLVWKGLKDNGFQAEALELASTTIRMLARDLANTGGLNEYYHPDSGSPLSHSGFMDWNLLALEMIS